jgi:hypothetical protein
MKYSYFHYSDNYKLCPDHGFFIGRGMCPICKSLDREHRRVYDFTKRLSILYSNKFIFKIPYWVDIMDKVDVLCDKHGKFKTILHDALSGVAICKYCSDRNVNLKKNRNYIE